MKSRYTALAVETKFWKPKENYIQDLIESIKNIVVNGDFVTVSEKAISTALGNIVNEKNVKPSKLAQFIAKYWMKIVWPRILGPICHLRKKNN